MGDSVGTLGCLWCCSFGLHQRCCTAGPRSDCHGRSIPWGQNTDVGCAGTGASGGMGCSHTPLGVLGWFWPEEMWDCSWGLSRTGTTNGWRQQWLQKAPLAAEPEPSCSQNLSLQVFLSLLCCRGSSQPWIPARPGERERSAAPQPCQLQGKGQRGHGHKSHPLTAIDFQVYKQILPRIINSHLPTPRSPGWGLLPSISYQISPPPPLPAQTRQIQRVRSLCSCRRTLL